ncbi:alpha-N-acetylglucosaminidase [Actinomadura gamaensis]|uniref:Alpha-N-acetylglucosaminidase n=1 Tax=Actinomadura gamaensis TaxID=1763541 RepID=A0ABV9UAE3_9ACTN
MSTAAADAGRKRRARSRISDRPFALTATGGALIIGMPHPGSSRGRMSHGSPPDAQGERSQEARSLDALRPQAGSWDTRSRDAGTREAGTREAGSWDTRPVEALLNRLLPASAQRRIELRALPLSPDELAAQPRAERYQVERRDDAVRISATTPSAMLTGFNAYLERVVGVSVSWNGDSLDRLVDARMPLPTRELHGEAVVRHRYAGNDTDDGYTGPYRDWQQWEREIDVLALHGINEVFLPVGAEAVYFDAFLEFGYTADELLCWIPQPGHQPWWLLQNLSGFPSAPSLQLVEKRAALGRRIADRLRELGMTPVFPGYFGTVPPGFAERNAGARVVPQPDWIGFTRPDWLDPTSPQFARVAQAFYASSERRFGASTAYKMDLLHEGGTAGPVDIAAATRAVQNALHADRPGATWVLLGWQENPRKEILAAADRSTLFIVDGLSDRRLDFDRDEIWLGTPYAFGSIWNFGGHTTIGANAGLWPDRFREWHSRPGSALDGIAVLPEASDNNPAAFAFFTDLAWRDNKLASGSARRSERSGIDPQAWFSAWADRRYGAPDPNAARAWEVLATTAYGMPQDGWSEPQDGLFAATPSLTAASAAPWSPRRFRYDPEIFAHALPALLAVAPDLRASSAYRYDLADVARQVLTNRSRTLLPKLKAAYDRTDRPAFDRLAAEWTAHLDLLDEIAAANRQTMLGPWLADARRFATTADEGTSLERDARILLTVWGTRAGAEAGLADYANREWSGVISTYYAPRWKLFLDECSEAIAENREPRLIDWYGFGVDWVLNAGPLPEEPAGDVHEIATRVLKLTQSR